MRHGESVGRGTTADVDFIDSLGCGEVEGLRHVAHGFADGRSEGGIAGQNERRVVAEPAEHLQVGATAEEQPFSGGRSTEMHAIPRQVPWHALPV